ncbi:DMT family transporter [Hymenobacter latericus]|uniref:DMT family transporter n=1 Tax=Hymenobacter sp. YIM 151858-1 TaxID=2987688 RepID=UPI002226D642|nr:DMT family transporter [Hymenobacter sp. YIM 151858-1]UYZ60965.1 DMT family transporter [Hymenobacter sp. YIM 151858-1]
MNQPSNPLRVHTALFIVSLIYAANYSLSKEVMPHHVGPYGIVVLRVVTAAVVFEVLARLFAKERITGRADNIRSILCGISGIGLNQLLFFGGLNLTTPISASLVQTISPIVVVLASVVLLGERITLKRALGIGLAGTGAAMVILSRGPAGAAGQSVALGNLLILLNATFFGLYLVLVAPLMRKYHAFTVLARSFLVGAFIVVPFGLKQALAPDYAHLPMRIWVIILYMIVMLTVVAYLLNNWALKHASPALLGVYIYLQPILAVLIAVALGRDHLTWARALQGLLIFAGVWLVSQKPKHKTVIGKEVPLEPVQD